MYQKECKRKEVEKEKEECIEKIGEEKECKGKEEYRGMHREEG